MKKIGLLGLGNMGYALLRGIYNSNLCKEFEILAYDTDSQKVKKAREEFNIAIFDDARDLIDNASYIILAIKPNDVEAFLKREKLSLDKEDKIFITIAAGLTVKFYRKFLEKVKIVRVMPNTPFITGNGVSGIYFDGSFRDEEKNTAIQIFESGGIVEVVNKENLLDVITGLSGSGPAYVFTFINSLADGGVFAGLPRDVARRIAIKTVLGSAMLAEKENLHPEELKDKVTSPGGTTAMGLLALEEGNFRASVIKAVLKATEKAKEIGEKQ